MVPRAGGTASSIRSNQSNQSAGEQKRIHFDDDDTIAIIDEVDGHTAVLHDRNIEYKRRKLKEQAAAAFARSGKFRSKLRSWKETATQNLKLKKKHDALKNEKDNINETNDSHINTKNDMNQDSTTIDMDHLQKHKTDDVDLKPNLISYRSTEISNENEILNDTENIQTEKSTDLQKTKDDDLDTLKLKQLDKTHSFRLFLFNIPDREIKNIMSMQDPSNMDENLLPEILTNGFQKFETNNLECIKLHSCHKQYSAIEMPMFIASGLPTYQKIDSIDDSSNYNLNQKEQLQTGNLMYQQSKTQQSPIPTIEVVGEFGHNFDTYTCSKSKQTNNKLSDTLIQMSKNISDKLVENFLTANRCNLVWLVDNDEQNPIVYISKNQPSQTTVVTTHQMPKTISEFATEDLTAWKEAQNKDKDGSIIIDTDSIYGDDNCDQKDTGSDINATTCKTANSDLVNNVTPSVDEIDEISQSIEEISELISETDSQNAKDKHGNNNTGDNQQQLQSQKNIETTFRAIDMLRYASMEHIPLSAVHERAWKMFCNVTRNQSLLRHQYRFDKRFARRLSCHLKNEKCDFWEMWKHIAQVTADLCRERGFSPTKKPFVQHFNAKNYNVGRGTLPVLVKQRMKYSYSNRYITHPSKAEHVVLTSIEQIATKKSKRFLSLLSTNNKI